MQILCDTHFNRSKLVGAASYNFFAQREDLKPINKYYYDRVMALCSSPIIKEPMGSDKRLYDIYGLTPKDILAMDLDTLMDLEERVSRMRSENERELIARLNKMKEDAKNT